MTSPCKNDSTDATPEHLPSSQHCANLKQRDGYWVGPELGVPTYATC